MTAGHLGAVTAAAHRRNPSPPSYTGPLDLTATQAVVAYGQRALSAAKLGSALYTIRRSSDDTTQSFNSDAMTGEAPVAAIEAFIGGGNGFVATWNDQSGNTSNALQTTSAKQPGWLASTSGGRSGLSFSAATVQWLATAGNVSLPNGASTVFVVSKGEATHASMGFAGINWSGGSDPNGPDWLAAIGASSSLAVQLGADDLNFNNGAGFNDAATPDFDTVYSVIDMGFSTLSHSLNFNGAPVSVTDAGYGNGNSGAIAFPLAIGSEDALSEGLLFNGQIMELIILPMLLSDADRLAIRQNIAAYYGITLS